MRRRTVLFVAVAVAFGLVAALGGGVGARPAKATSVYDRLTPMQKRLVSGFAALELEPQLFGGDEESSGSGAPVTTKPLARPITCPRNLNTNIRVNQNCLNVSDSTFQGRSQAQNETAVAANPTNPSHLVASYNDYRRGDGTCGVSYSSDGKTWKDATTPNGFTRGTNFGSVARQYWQAGGDTSVAWDTHGNAYLLCMVFMRGSTGQPPITNNPDLSSAFYLYRSTESNGASWNFPGRPVEENNDVGGSGASLLDKPYMTVDSNASSPFRDRIYVSWTFFAEDGTANIYEAYSNDYGESFSAPVLVSNASSSLCGGPCTFNQFSQPFTGPDGSLYVVFDNYNNTVVGNDNRNQVLIEKSTDGGASFGAPVKVSDFYDLPDCAAYQNHQDPARACVPEKGPSTYSVFRATNYPSGAVDPTNPSQIAVTFGSYINKNSNESNGCTPDGIGGDGLNHFIGVKTAGACNNDILVSVSTDGGATFTGTTTDPRGLTSVTQTGRQVVTDQFWQWEAFTDTGRLAVAYFDRQYGTDERTGFSDISLSNSSHLNAFASTRVTTSSMPPPTEFTNSVGNGLFIGDYIGLGISADVAFPIWPDTRVTDLFLCDGTGEQGVPPELCTGNEPNGLQANDQDIYTAGVHVP
jgi:hypothetical protein